MGNKNSKQKIRDAYLELLEENRIGKVSVSQIIDKAGVSRPTYYRYYYEQSEILADIIDEFMNDLAEATTLVGTPDICPDGNVQYSLFVYQELQCYYTHAELLRKLYTCDAEPLLREQIYAHIANYFDQWMELAKDTRERKLQVSFLDYETYKRYSCAGHYDVIRTWVMGGCKESIQAMLEFTLKIGNANKFFISFG